MTDLADNSSEGEARLRASDRREIQFGQQSVALEPRRTVLFVGATGTISDRLVQALTREFPWLVPVSVDDLLSACRTFVPPVALILVDFSLLSTAEQSSSELARLHPHALTAVIQRDDFTNACSFPEILNFPSIRGVLPMNVSLDVWVSVLRLMLCGGEYFPPEMIRRCVRQLGELRAIPATGRAAEAQVADLTAREVQIIEMVARGLQNKTIAAEFRLSEHTVKIHLHNIISKLGAHNRTEAVARFRELREHRLMSRGNGHPPPS
jgi:DNA-binding NarL/FixJ family response regulator